MNVNVTFFKKFLFPYALDNYIDFISYITINIQGN